MASAHFLTLPVCGVLEQGALPSPLLDGRGAEDRPDGLVKHSLQAALGQGRALQVLHRTDLFGHGQALGVGDRGELLLPELLDGVLIVPQIQLGAH